MKKIAIALRPPSLRMLPVQVVLLLALVGGGLAIGVVEARPAFALCNSGSCNNLDPSQQRCDADARALEDITVSTLRVRLMYSPACNAVWTLGTGHGAPVLEAYADQSLNYPVARRVGPQAGGGRSWTPMLSFRYWVRSCDNFWGTCTRLR